MTKTRLLCLLLVPIVACSGGNGSGAQSQRQSSTETSSSPTVGSDEAPPTSGGSAFPSTCAIPTADIAALVGDNVYLDQTSVGDDGFRCSYRTGKPTDQRFNAVDIDIYVKNPSVYFDGFRSDAKGNVQSLRGVGDDAYVTDRPTFPMKVVARKGGLVVAVAILVADGPLAQKYANDPAAKQTDLTDLARRELSL